MSKRTLYFALLISILAISLSACNTSATLTLNAEPVSEDAPGGPGASPAQQAMPDFAAAAATLGVTEEDLMVAMGEPGQPPDFAAVAAALGVTEEALMEALGISGDIPQGGGGPGGQGGPPPGGQQLSN